MVGNLKYLDFVHVVGVYVVFCFNRLYKFAKVHSGPLGPGIQPVEETVRAVIRLLYDKLRDMPLEALQFVVHKVNKYVNELDSLVLSMVKRASRLIRAVASELHEAGLIGTARDVAKCVYYQYEPMARELYLKYEPVAEHYAGLAWRRLNAFPLFPQVAMLAVPTAAYWAEKYNSAVRYSVDREYMVMEFLPLIPTERIAKMFEEPEREHVQSNEVTANRFPGDEIAEK